MPSAVTTINGITKRRHNTRSKPVKEAVSRATVELRNDSDYRQAVWSLRGHYVAFEPGETRRVSVPLKEAYRMKVRQLLSGMTVMRLTKHESEDV